MFSGIKRLHVNDQRCWLVAEMEGVSRERIVNPRLNANYMDLSVRAMSALQSCVGKRHKPYQTEEHP